ncbi:MAG: hypothetical protein GY722_29185 [bacterium]|nr:hypothetical protein [bacterium]
MDRDQFLGRVKSALRGAELPEVTGPAQPPPITFADRVARFADSAIAVSAKVVRVGDAGEALEEIARLMDGEERFLAWDDLGQVLPGWDTAVQANAWHRVDENVGAASRTADHHRIGSVQVGITTADIGIAATGSVVLQHGPGRPRSASLLVEHHIVVLPIDRIVASMAEALNAIDWADTSNVVAITGPSRTNDIESILTLGVHGPRHVSIVLIG